MKSNVTITWTVVMTKKWTVENWHEMQSFEEKWSQIVQAPPPNVHVDWSDIDRWRTASRIAQTSDVSEFVCVDNPRHDGFFFLHNITQRFIFTAFLSLNLNFPIHLETPRFGQRFTVADSKYVTCPYQIKIVWTSKGCDAGLAGLVNCSICFELKKFRTNFLEWCCKA